MMTTENQPARMGDNALTDLIAWHSRDGTKRGELTHAALLELQRARELSAHGGDGGGEDAADGPCKEFDGCPTEKAVLQRFWRSVEGGKRTQGKPPTYASIDLGYIEHLLQQLATVKTDDNNARTMLKLAENELKGCAAHYRLQEARKKDAALATQQPASGEVAGWYCPHCQRGVDGRDVTFTEQHEECGTYIGDATPPNAAHGGGGEVGAYQYATGPHDWQECTPQVYLSMQERGVKVRKRYTRPPTPPTSASDAEVEAVVDELQDLAGYSFNAECCNSTFPIGQLRRVCRQAAALLTRSPARVGEDDTARLDAIASEYLHLIPFAMPTPGGDDADVGWVVKQSTMRDGDVELARHYRDDPRAAIDAALAQHPTDQETP